MKNTVFAYTMLILGFLGVIAPLQAHRRHYHKRIIKHAVPHAPCRQGMCQRRVQQAVQMPSQRPVQRVSHAHMHRRHQQVRPHHHARVHAHGVRHCATGHCQVRRMQPRMQINVRVQAPVRMHRAPQRAAIKRCAGGACRYQRPVAHIHVHGRIGH